MVVRTSTLMHNLLMGCAILLVALVSVSAKADDRGGQFLPLHQKGVNSATISKSTNRQYIPLRGIAREGTQNKMIPLHGGASARTWKLTKLKDETRVAKAKDVPMDVKLAMANGYVPRAMQKADMLPKAGDKREAIAAALAPVMSAHDNVMKEENIDTDIEDAHEALAESLTDTVHEAVNKALAYVWPVADAHYRISSPYGYRKHPITGKRAFHAGIDIPAPRGTDVMAVIGGKVEAVGTHPRLGRYVKVNHDDGTYSLYGHLNDWSTKAGRTVNAGDVIGKVGSTGRSTGPHLDFSIRRDGKSFNPMNILAKVLEEKKLAMRQ